MRRAPSAGVRVLTSSLLVLALVAATLGAVRLLRPRQAVAVLGDSMTALAKAPLLDDGHDAGYAMSVDGIPGVRLSARMAAVEALSHHTSGPVVIELGTNDVLQGAPPEELAALVDQAVTDLRAVPCVVFVAVGILYDVDGRAHGFNEHLRQAVSGHPNLHVYDWETEFRQHPDWTTDTVHLRPEYVGRYAAGIIDTIRDDC